MLRTLPQSKTWVPWTILCTDKTGTITADEVVLERHLNILGEEDPRVLRHAYLNSYFQTGLRNLIDNAIIKTSNDELPTNLLSIEYEKIDEVPFDFERRRMSVVVRNTKTDKTQMITKGAVEEVLNACSFVDLDSEIKPLTPAQRKSVMDRVYQLNQEGMRVVGVAQKSDPRGVGEFGVDDERDMVLIGYLAFLDPPKESAREAMPSSTREACRSRYSPVTTKASQPQSARRWASTLTSSYLEAT